jgi:hypothetical protein
MSLSDLREALSDLFLFQDDLRLLLLLLLLLVYGFLLAFF